MKRFIALLLALTVLFALAACNKNPNASQTGTTTTTEEVTGVAAETWTLSIEDDSHKVQHYVLDLKNKQLTHSVCILWSELFNAETWEKTKQTDSESIISFNGKEYYADLTYFYNVTYDIDGNNVSLMYQATNGPASEQKLTLEDEHTLRIISDSSTATLLNGKAYTCHHHE